MSLLFPLVIIINVFIVLEKKFLMPLYHLHFSFFNFEMARHVTKCTLHAYSVNVRSCCLIELCETLVVILCDFLQDVFVLDTGKMAFVWVGSDASAGEKKNGMAYAHVSTQMVLVIFTNLKCIYSLFDLAF